MELSGMTLPWVIEAVRSDDTILSDTGVVEQHRVYSDKAVIAYRAPVEHGLVADRDASAYGRRNAGVRVDDYTVLDIGIFENRDGFVIAPYDGVIPDAYVVVDYYGADYDRVVRDVIIVPFYFYL